jgi:hypothetical protein
VNHQAIWQRIPAVGTTSELAKRQKNEKEKISFLFQFFNFCESCSEIGAIIYSTKLINQICLIFGEGDFLILVERN